MLVVVSERHKALRAVPITGGNCVTQARVGMYACVLGCCCGRNINKSTVSVLVVFFIFLGLLERYNTWAFV